MFPREAEGLCALRAVSPIRVPNVAITENADGEVPAYIVMDDVTATRGNAQPQPPGRFDSDAILGQGLAQIHRETAAAFGFDYNNYIGSTPQPNEWASSWVEFYREKRICHLVRLLKDEGAFDRGDIALSNRFLARLDLILGPVTEMPSLLHGDLWGGNVIRDPDGFPVLIDPAVYYGHREADVAMTELFGGFGKTFYAAYQEAYPLSDGYCERRDVYNLYHILNHALLFGGGYKQQALAIMRRYSGP
jgi:fructosamine-3-kinase